MENNINTNLNDYSIEELINLLELKEDFTKEDVIEKISFFILIILLKIIK